MKVCILSVKFFETTFPLARHLAKLGHDITLICILPKFHRRDFIIDFSSFDVRSGFDDRYNEFVFNHNLTEYLQNVKLHSLFFSNRKNNPFNIFIANKLTRFISSEKFQLVHLIGSSSFITFVHLLLRKTAVVQTLHEVTTHEENLTLPLHQRSVLNILCRRDIKLILHSSISEKRFVDYYSKYDWKKYPIENRIFNIPFGLFETYKYFDNNEDIEEEKSTVLFFGRILPYKGICYLIDSVGNLLERIPDIKLIIAGEGKIELNEKLLPNIEFINKVISNELLIQLIKRSTVVSCPYISASQSGIPMVAFLYKKPVIATEVGAFPEVIDHMKTGILVKPKDVDALAEAIEKLLLNPDLIKKIKANISDKYSETDYSWNKIAVLTTSVYQKAYSDSQTINN
ncbi:MAG: glycosyltransferase family 4 protein [Bacteroidales bacterium]|nr:glycosyltransferase family 4 protein [Bacteroidales bacterium]